MNNAQSGSESKQIEPTCHAIVPYVERPDHGLHARSLSYTFSTLNIKVELKQRYGQEGAGVGGAQWPAGYVLAEYLSRSPSLEEESSGDVTSTSYDWTDKKVIELGAGLGLVSIIAAFLGAKVAATDGIEGVLPILESNIQQAAMSSNMSTPASMSADTSASTSAPADKVAWRHPIQTHLLRWGQEEDELRVMASLNDSSTPQGHPPPPAAVDVVLAADVVYGDKIHVWRQLIRCLRHISSPHTVIVLAHFSRYPDKEKEFFKLLDKSFERRIVGPTLLAENSERTSVYILKPKEAPA